MKAIVFLLCFMAGLVAFAQPSVQRNAYTTNLPGAAINIGGGSISGGSFNGNGAGMTNITGEFSQATNQTIGYVNTNVIILTNGISAFNTSWTWDATHSRYTNAGLYSIYFSVGDQNWYMTNGAGQVFYDTCPAVSATDRADFPYAWYINGSCSGASSVATNPVPTGTFQILTSNTVAFTQSPPIPTNGVTYFGANIHAQSIVIPTNNNVVDNPLYGSENSVIEGQANTLVGYNAVAIGSSQNYDIGSQDVFLGSAQNFVVDFGSDNVFIASEFNVLQSGAGVNTFISTVTSTNYSKGNNTLISSQLSGIYGGNSPYTGYGQYPTQAEYDTILSGSSTLIYQSLQATAIGPRVVISNANNSAAIGQNILTTAANVQVFGNGLTNSNAGTVQVGDTNANITFSNSTSTVTGVLVPSSGILGVTVTNNAAAGIVGEFMEATAAITANSLTNNVGCTNLTLNLTAGDWDVTGVASIQITSGTTSVSSVSTAGISTNASYTTNSLTTYILTPTLAASSATFSQAIARTRVTCSATTPVYMRVSLAFTGGTASAGGEMSARRVR